MKKNRTNRLRYWVVGGIGLALVFTLLGLLIVQFTVNARIEQFADRFLLLSVLRKQTLEQYIDTVRSEITFWSLNEQLRKNQAELLHARERLLHAGDNHAEQAAYDSALNAIHDRLHPLARMFVVKRGYYDFFLITPGGDVLYTVEKESDYGTNLLTGPWRDTGLADVFRRALASAAEGSIVFSDFAAYGPSAGAPAMFAARAMIDPDGRPLGVLAMQLPSERIRSIMQFTAGMGESGETYLVGEDLLMRSDSRFVEESTVLRVKVDTDPVRRALSGDSGTLFAPDYRDVPVLSAFSHVTIDGFRWAVLAEIDRDEVLQTVAEKRPQIAGLMLFLYAITLWTGWFVRQGDWSTGENPGGPLESDHLDVGDAGV